MIKIRRVVEEDSEILFEWRNNPEIFKYSLNPNKVSLENHQNWFRKILKDSQCVFYMCIVNDTRCGSVRYHLSEDGTEAEVSISVAPEFWGRGIASSMLSHTENCLKAETNVTVINATVLNDNKASMKLFSKAEFLPVLTKFKKSI